MLLGVGLLYGSRIWSFEQMLMDCEIFDIVHHMMRGIVVEEETLALDVIRAVGPGGHYLTQEHTRQHMRDLWLPKTFDRRSYKAWEVEGGGARSWARDRALHILNTHEPEPLDPPLSRELDRIVDGVATPGRRSLR
jgi:trimethylamine--corrinoid protein Co-methyltransferase